MREGIIQKQICSGLVAAELREAFQTFTDSKRIIGLGRLLFDSSSSVTPLLQPLAGQSSIWEPELGLNLQD